MAFDPNLYITPVAAALPLVVAAVTKSDTSSTVKGWTLAFLSALTALVAELSTVGFDGFDWDAGFSNFLLAFIAAFSSYKGGLTKGAAQKIAQRTRDRGIGKSEQKDEAAGPYAAPVVRDVVPTTADDPDVCTDPACIPDEELVLYTEEGKEEPK